MTDESPWICDVCGFKNRAFYPTCGRCARNRPRPNGKTLNGIKILPPAIRFGGDLPAEHGATGHYYNPPEPVRFHGSEYYRAEMPKLAEIGKNDFSITMAKDYLSERIVLEAGQAPTSIHFCGPSKGGATITPRPDGKTEVIGWIAK